jgi:hypothetical protein
VAKYVAPQYKILMALLRALFAYRQAVHGLRFDRSAAPA